MTESLFERLPRFHPEAAGGTSAQLGRLKAFDAAMHQPAANRDGQPPLQPNALHDSQTAPADETMDARAQPEECSPGNSQGPALHDTGNGAPADQSDAQAGDGDDEAESHDSYSLETSGPSADTDAVVRLLSELTEEIERVEALARNEVVGSIETIARQVFPHLAELFLADEIAIHLREFVPVKAQKLVICAPEPTASDLKGKLADGQLNGLPVEVTPLADEGAAVEITWGQGGVAFDFRAFLEDCLHRLIQLKSNKGAG